VLKQKGESVSDRAQVVGADSFRDVALIRSGEAIDGHVFTLAEQDPRLGEEVVALGFPLGGTFPTFDVTVTRGSVSGLHRTVNIDGVERTRLIQTDAAINPGNSGGPLISLETAEVVSIADAIANQDELPGAEGCEAKATQSPRPRLAPDPRWRGRREPLGERHARTLPATFGREHSQSPSRARSSRDGQ
jgi:serine protease Do